MNTEENVRKYPETMEERIEQILHEAGVYDRLNKMCMKSGVTFEEALIYYVRYVKLPNAAEFPEDVREAVKRHQDTLVASDLLVDFANSFGLKQKFEDNMEAKLALGFSGLLLGCIRAVAKNESVCEWPIGYRGAWHENWSAWQLVMPKESLVSDEFFWNTHDGCTDNPFSVSEDVEYVTRLLCKGSNLYQGKKAAYKRNESRIYVHVYKFISENKERIMLGCGNLIDDQRLEKKLAETEANCTGFVRDTGSESDRRARSERPMINLWS